MSFSIKKSHKYTDLNPVNKDSSSKLASTSDLLTSDDYMLFDITSDTLSSGSAKAKAPVKPRKGGNYIHSINSAQEDYF